MAGVINKPDALSLSGNLKSFVLSSGSTVMFGLKKGDRQLFERSYEPGPDSLVRIDLKEVIEGLLSFKLDAAAAHYTQPELFADFTALIDGSEYPFRVVRSGVANLADTPSNFLKLHFLTWQPRVKRVTYYSPEWLTLYAVEACSVKLKATFPDKSTTLTSLLSCTAGMAYTLNVQYAFVAGKLGNRYPSYYEVWTERASGAKLSESQFYAYSDPLSEDEQWFLFENSLGGIDTIRAYGASALMAEHEHRMVERSGMREEYEVDTHRKFEKNTGYLDAYERRWLLDFFPSKAKYIHDAAAIRRIVVTDSDAKYVSGELPSSYTFTWQLAEISPLLNIQKNEIAIPDNLVAPDLSSPDFILPPRLVELPRLSLSEGVLIPAFDPFTPKPAVITFGAVFNTIKNAIADELEDELAKIGALSGSGGSGSGGTGNIKIIKTDDLTMPTDENVFSSLRTLAEIDKVILEANDMFLRKDIDDTAHGVILFDKKIGSSVFLDGFDGKGWEVQDTGNAIFNSIKLRSDIFLGGKAGSPSFASGFTGWGWEIDTPTATGEMDNLFIRKTFTAYEIVYSQIYGLGGSQIVSDLNKILRVEVMADRYRCYMDDMDGLMLMNLRKGDGVRIQSRTGTTSIKYIMGRCIGTDSDYFDIAIPLLEGTGKPEAGDFAMRWGNNEDADRQGLIYLTSADHYAPFIDVYDGITDVSTEGKLKARLGNLNGIRTQKGDQLAGYGAYLNGVYVENSTILLQDGDTVEQRFVAMNGRFDSEISGIKNDMSLERGNILRNSSFSENTHYWQSSNLVHFIRTSSGYLWFDGYFYVEKERVADIYKDGPRNVLRIRNCSISQENAVMRLEGTKEERTYSFAFFVKALTPGTLTAGISGTELHHTEALSPTGGYQKIVKAGKWNEEGDFAISFTGECLLYGASLFNDLLADAQVKLSTRILQTEEMISMMATKDYVDRETGAIKIHYDSELLVTAERMSGISTRVDNISNTINTAGWITEADSVQLFAREFSNTGVTNAIAQLNVKYNAIYAAVAENEQGISNVSSLASSAANTAQKALFAGVYGQEQYSQPTDPFTSWPVGSEYKHSGALWYNTNTKVTKRFTGADGTWMWETVPDTAVSAASFVLQHKDKWSLVVANFDADGNPTEASGIVTTAYGNSFWVKKDAIISTINQTAEAVSIDASKINLNGVVTANNNFKILPDGSMESVNGKFSGKLTVSDIEGSNVITYGAAYRIVYDGNRIYTYDFLNGYSIPNAWMVENRNGLITIVPDASLNGQIVPGHFPVVIGIPNGTDSDFLYVSVIHNFVALNGTTYKWAFRLSDDSSGNIGSFCVLWLRLGKFNNEIILS